MFHVGPSGFNNTIDCLAGFTPKDILTVKLSFPDVVVDEHGNKGFWTLIYNQGFEVVVGGRKYFAFSLYSMVDKKTVISFCNYTFTGWSHDLKGDDWACYRGVKENASQAVRMLTVSSIDENDLDRKYVKNPDFIYEINSKTDLWEAVHYPELEGMTYRERLRRGGGGRHVYPKTAPVSKRDLEAVKDLPEDFDWRDVSGNGYVSPIRDQGTCGSCYAFGSMAMLEARFRILSNSSMHILSTQEIVSCSEYSQGCEGGFPYLIAGKYAEDFGVVADSCVPYDGKDIPCASLKKPECTKNRYHATDYHYIGGYYGACNEQLMLAELHQNGPIAVSFEVTADFHAYKKGIYHRVGVEDTFNPWEITNHVVAIVGYGVEDGMKYWTVQNSWGSKWGEDGFFRIIRGADELSIESMAVAVTPVLPSGN